MVLDMADVPLDHVQAGLVLPVELQLGRVAQQQKQLVGRGIQQRFDQVVTNAATSTGDKNTFGERGRSVRHLRILTKTATTPRRHPRQARISP
jgi:hypothetical protein